MINLIITLYLVSLVQHIILHQKQLEKLSSSVTWSDLMLQLSLRNLRGVQSILPSPNLTMSPP